MDMKPTQAKVECRCSLCDEPIEVGEQVVRLDNEAIHAECAEYEGLKIDWPGGTP
jgi:hypothetical protein